MLTYSSNADKHEDNPEDCDSKLSVLKNRLTGRITRKGQEVELYFSRKSKRITSKKGFESGVKEYGWLKRKPPQVAGMILRRYCEVCHGVAGN